MPRRKHESFKIRSVGIGLLPMRLRYGLILTLDIPMKEEKTCTECGLELPIEEFYLKKNVVKGKTYTQHQSRCKECNKRVCKHYARRRPKDVMKKNKSVTMKDFEDCLIQTICAQAMLAEVKTRKKKPLMGSAQFIFLIIGSNKKVIFEELTKWKTEAAEFIEANKPKESN